MLLTLETRYALHGLGRAHRLKDLTEMLRVIALDNECLPKEALLRAATKPAKHHAPILRPRIGRAARRAEARSRREAHDFFFGRPELLEVYEGVLVRDALVQEHTFYGLLDDVEAYMTAESGMERVTRVIDDMPAAIRSNLVIVGFMGFHHCYHLLLGWAGSALPEYDGVEIGDTTCRSVVVEDVPRRFRDLLPETLRVSL